jgi:cytochrome c biogenesis protein
MARKTDSTPPPAVGFWQGLFDSLSSVKLAVVLLVIIALASVVGMLFPQAPASDLETRAMVAEMYRQRYGTAFGGLLVRLAVPDLYHSTWYLGLLLLLALSAFVCGCKAWKRAARQAAMPTVRATRKAVERMREATKARSRLPAAAARDASLQALRGLGYQVAHNESDDGAHCIVGRKRAWAVWGSPLMHLSLLLIILSGVVSCWPGASFERPIRLLPGESFDGADPQPTAVMPFVTDDARGRFDFTVRLNDFRIEYYPDGRVSEYLSDVSVLENGHEAKRQAVKVNAPLKYGPVKLYQSDWGLNGAAVSARGPEGQQEHLVFPLQPSGDGWEVILSDPETDEILALQPIKATGWSLFAHAFAPAYAVYDAAGQLVATDRQPGPDEQAGTAAREPVRPALLLYVFPDFANDTQNREPLGWLLEGHPLSYQGWTFELAGLQMYSGLVAGRNPGVPILYIGFTLVVLSMFVALYLAPRTVRAHLNPAARGTEIVVGGATRMGPGFEREFERLLAAVEARGAAAPG